MYAIPLSLAQQLRSEGAFSVFEGASPLTSLLLPVELRGFEFYSHNSPKMATSAVLQRTKRIDAHVIRTQIRQKEQPISGMCPLRGRFFLPCPTPPANCGVSHYSPAGGVKMLTFRHVVLIADALGVRVSDLLEAIELQRGELILRDSSRER